MEDNKTLEKDSLVDQLAIHLGLKELPNHDWLDEKSGKTYYETKFGLRERGKCTFQ